MSMSADLDMCVMYSCSGSKPAVSQASKSSLSRPTMILK